MSDEYRKLVDITQQFVDANNSGDLDATMDFFPEDVVFEDMYGGRHEGKDQVRIALTPFFDGTYGTLEYVGENLFIDAEERKVMSSWRCDMHVPGQPTSFLRGLDLLHFRGDKISEKLAYGKAKEALFQQ